jgi:putative ABC transport system ATP-binding protein
VRVPALRSVDLEVERGAFLVVAGPSGSGKTTLLNLLGALDQPDEGQVLFEGEDLARRSDAERTRWRRKELGFVFQAFSLVPVLSAFENVEYALWLDGVGPGERRRRVGEALAAVGLQDRERHRPDQLSGGERQRVAIARALVHQPKLVLADEPTANLDSRTGGEVVELLLRLTGERGATVVISSHDPAVIARARTTVRISDGALAEPGPPQ